MRLKRKVALRLLNSELTADDRFRERFLRESKLAASLEHPNIVPVSEASEAEGHLYIAMPSVEGTDLASLLAREGRLEPKRALAIVTQLADALDAARFRRGLMHGSLSASDVLLAHAQAGSGERVYLSGFGLRQELPARATLAEAAERFASVECLAPEQIEGKPVSPRTDVYALGCLLFAWLTGEPPYKGETAEAVLEAHLHKQPPSAVRLRPELPAAIDRVIETALAKWPEERTSTCGELAAAAKAALAPASEESERAPEEDPFLPAAALPRPGQVVPGELPPSAVAAKQGSLRQRLGGRGQASLAAVGLVLLLAALVAGIVWLTGGHSGDVRSATPPPPVAEAPGDFPAGVLQEGQITAEQRALELAPVTPAQAEPAPVTEEPDLAADRPPELIVSLGPASLVRLDAETGEILARVAIPSPLQLAADGGSVWVLGGGGPSGALLVRVEAATNAVTDIFDADVGSRTGPSAFAAAGGSAWLGSFNWGRLYRFSPGASAAEPVELDAGGREFSRPIAAAGSLWGAVDPIGCCIPTPVLLRVDPATERVLARIDGVGPVVASGEGFLWAYTREPGSAAPSLVRVETGTLETSLIGPLKLRNADFAVADGAVWALTQNGTIVRLDPVTGEETERIRVWRAPAALAGEAGVSVPIAAGGGAVWAANLLDGTVARYDIATGRIETIDVGGTPIDLVRAGDSIWVAVTSPTKEEYTARAEVICTEANERLAAVLTQFSVPGAFDLDEIRAFHVLAAHFSEEALAELRALPVPPADRAGLEKEYSLREREIDFMRQVAAARVAGDIARAEDLIEKRIDLTHKRHDGTLPSTCPVNLPA